MGLQAFRSCDPSVENGTVRHMTLLDTDHCCISARKAPQVISRQIPRMLQDRERPGKVGHVTKGNQATRLVR